MSDTSRSDIMEDCSPLSQACIRALTDKLDDKRKFAANEIEKMTVGFMSTNNLTMVNRLIIVLSKFCLSHQHQNIRKGGLLGLVAVMAGYRNGSHSEPTPEIVQEVISPILTCLLDEDPRVRYYAYEALYNVVRFSRANVLPQFELIFDSMTRIVADIDVSVKTGFETLDKLIKDIIVEQKKNFTIDPSFVAKFKEYLGTKNPFARMFIMSWIQFLDRLDLEMDMVDYLPELLDGIFNCLYDDPEPIRATALNLLSEFLNKIDSRPTDKLNMPSMIRTLIKHAEINVRRDQVQYTAIQWLGKLISYMDNQDLARFTPVILEAILPCLAYRSRDDHNSTILSNDSRRTHATSPQRSIPQTLNRTKIRKISADVNSLLLELITEVLKDQKQIDSIANELEVILTTLARELNKNEDPIIKLAVLNWIKTLKKIRPEFISTSISQQRVFDALLDTLLADSDAVVRETLQVITEVFCDENINQDEEQTIAKNLDDQLRISENEETHELERKKSPSRVTPTQSPGKLKTKKVAIKTSDTTTTTTTPPKKVNASTTSQFVQTLYKKFIDNQAGFEKRGTFIILSLCDMIKPDLVYKSFAEILKDEKSNVKFAYDLVQKLNQILFTTQPLAGLRFHLGSSHDPATKALINMLYSAWFHAPVAAISLCLLTNNDCQANELVVALSAKEINIETLTQIDWLIKLIESPILQPLRMRLLDFNSNQHLIKCLYGLLMYLPQSEARSKLGSLLEEVYRFAIIQSHFKSMPTSPQATSAGTSGGGGTRLSSASSSITNSKEFKK